MPQNSRLLQAARLAAVALATVLATACSKPETLADQLDAIAQRAKEAGELNGNVLITRGDQVLYEESFGPADSSADIDNDANTKFLVASISKPLTALLVLQLVQAGKLQTDTRLDAVFPELVGKPAGAVTIHNLLTHTSGIKELISRDPWHRMSVKDLETAAVSPNSAFEYSNTGFVCLVLVIEAVTKQTYEQAMTTGVFEPAGMKDSGLQRTGVPVKGLARGHRGVIGLMPVDPDFAPEAVDGAGSIYATARDLARFDRALKNNLLLPASLQDLMVQEHIPGRYGYGWFLSEQDGRYYPWHSGDMAGYSASFARQTDRDETVIVLGNTAATEARRLQTEFLQVLKRQP